MNINYNHRLSAAKNKTVLLVKASTSERLSGGSTLFKDGWNVIEANSIDSALEYREKKFDAVLSDLEFEGGCGFALASAFRTPFLLFSNDTAHRSDIQGDKIRPFNPALLSTQVRQLLN